MPPLWPISLPITRSSLVRCAPLALLLALGCTEDADTPVDPGVATEAVITAQALAFKQVTGGLDHSSGVTTAGKAYCWGRNFSGQLGDNSTENACVRWLSREASRSRR
jgi:alpha-tubulin suppressor-like RCC1 family protein